MKRKNVIKGRNGQHLNQREANLINDSKAAGLLLFQTKGKQAVTLTYDTDGLICLVDFLRMYEMNKRLFVILLRNITVAIKTVEANKFSKDLIEWSLPAAYVDPASWHVYLTYVPLQPYEAEGTLKSFLQQFVSQCNFASSETVEYAREFVEDLNSGVTYTVGRLEDYCSRISEQLIRDAQKNASARLCPKCSAKLMEQETACPYCGTRLAAREAKASGNDPDNGPCAPGDLHWAPGQGEKDGFVNQENGVITFFRGVNNSPKAVWLENPETTEKIIVTKFPFRIGKMEEICDYRIFNNNVSRKHADIIKDQGGYFVVDLASTNGTYLGGRRLQPGVKESLEDGSVLRFADAEFKFHLE